MHGLPESQFDLEAIAVEQDDLDVYKRQVLFEQCFEGRQRAGRHRGIRLQIKDVAPRRLGMVWRQHPKPLVEGKSCKYLLGGARDVHGVQLLSHQVHHLSLIHI